MSAPRRRSLWPREHGAYAQLLVPLATALAVSRATAASACLAIAACAVFLAHEPALVLLGQRGARAKREAGSVARRWLAATIAIAIALTACGAALSPAARPWIALPAALAGACGVAVARKRERSLAGEIAASVALASMGVPIAIAEGLAWPSALAMWGVFCAVFAIATIEVRAIAHRDVTRRARLATWGGACAIVAVLAARAPLVALATLPVVAVVAFGAARPTSPRALRRLGWTLATSALLTATALVVALRRPF